MEKRLNVAGVNWVSEKRDSGNFLEHYVSALREITNNHPLDILVGPDYSLARYSDSELKVLDFKSIESNLELLAKVSQRFPSVLLIPGTTPRVIDGKMRLCAPLFLDGSVGELYKETDCTESKVADNNGLVYERGNCSKNNLVFDGTKIAVEICGDRGKQIIDSDTFLEIIPAYTSESGFSLNALNNFFDRYALVCNGQNGLTTAFATFPSLRIFPENHKTRDWSYYSFKK
jgi:hypothetical protein